MKGFAMPEADKLAIAAHLHVLLRRKTGRVTDTEWMAVNAEYALEIVRFAASTPRKTTCPNWPSGLHVWTTPSMLQPPTRSAARCWT